jgi:hypothetical protein
MAVMSINVGIIGKNIRAVVEERILVFLLYFPKEYGKKRHLFRPWDDEPV